MTRAFVTAVLLVVVATADCSELSAAPTARATSYTMSQARAGQLAYYESCAECHGGKLEGVFGPPLAGGDDNVRYQSVAAVYEYMAAHMPHGNPESLPQPTYVAIMAFLLQAHRLPAGSRALTKAAIDLDTATIGPK